MNAAAAGPAAILRGLRTALLRHGRGEPALLPLPDQGLAHLHVRLAGTGLLARIPKQSQVGLPPAANLRHQQACFERAGPSGRVPRLVAVLQPGPELPRGALLVEEIVGRPAALPADLDALAAALGALHALPLPPAGERPPLADPADPLVELAAEIGRQAQHLDAARLDPGVRRCIEIELERLQQELGRADRPPRTLVAFDAHPGNFLLRGPRDAVLVDLEKCRYSHPGLDLAHATLYTSTTWDRASRAELSPGEVASFYRQWERLVGPELAAAARPWQVRLRHAMWLWSLTWCCKWRALADRPAVPVQDGEDWSGEHSEAALVEHVRERVGHYLSAGALARVRSELRDLQGVLA